jgi:hypothetical protein
MDLSQLGSERRTRIERHVRKKPEHAPLVERLLAKRAATSSEAERSTIDEMLDRISKPVDRWVWVFALAVLLFSGSVAGYASLRERQIEQAAARGTPTTAQVERMAAGSCTIGDKLSKCLALTVKVFPAGGAPYSASFTQPIPLEWLARVQPGAWLTVAVDPADAQHVTFDVRTMQVPPPSPPASR